MKTAHLEAFYVMVTMILLGFFGYYVYQEIVDVDNYIHVINDKKPGTVQWTTTESKKTVHHDAGTIWIKATSEATGKSCTFSVRNPFHADAYVIGGRFDLQHVRECSSDPTPNGGMAIVPVLIWLLCSIAAGIVLITIDG